MAESPAGKPVLAVDLGGTKIVTALITPQGEILSREYTPTLAEEGVKAVIARILATASGLLRNARLPYTFLSGIAIAAAGAIDGQQVDFSFGAPFNRHRQLAQTVSACL